MVNSLLIKSFLLFTDCFWHVTIISMPCFCIVHIWNIVFSMWSETWLRVNIHGKRRGIKFLEYFITRLFSFSLFYDQASFCLLDIQYIGCLKVNWLWEMCILLQMDVVISQNKIIFWKNEATCYGWKWLAIIRLNYKNTKEWYILQLYLRFEISVFTS